MAAPWPPHGRGAANGSRGNEGPSGHWANGSRGNEGPSHDGDHCGVRRRSVDDGDCRGVRYSGEDGRVAGVDLLDKWLALDGFGHAELRRYGLDSRLGNGRGGEAELGAQRLDLVDERQRRTRLQEGQLGCRARSSGRHGSAQRAWRRSGRLEALAAGSRGRLGTGRAVVGEEFGFSCKTIYKI